MYSIVLYENELYPCFSKNILGEELVKGLDFKDLDSKLKNMAIELKIKAHSTFETYYIIKIKSNNGIRLGVEQYAAQSDGINSIFPVVLEKDIEDKLRHYSKTLDISVFDNNNDILLDY